MKMKLFVEQLLNKLNWIVKPVRYFIDRPILFLLITLNLGVLTLYVSTISNHAPGNSGISTALEHLHDRVERLTDINLIPTVHADAKTGSEIHRASVVDAKLPFVDLSGSWLDHTDFTNSDLNNAKLNRIRMNYAILDGVDLTKAAMENANLKNTSMSGTIARLLNASKVRLEGLTINDAVFEDANLYKANISPYFS